MNSFNQKNNTTLQTRGMSLIEIMISVTIFSLIIALFASFQSDVFSLNRIIQTGLRNQSEAKKLVRPFANEVRSATPSNEGAYPIAEATATSFAFYSDIDGDGLREQVRYFLDGSDFKKGFIKPSGNPLTYNSQDEEIVHVVHDVSPQTIFYYYDSTYDGTSESVPLTHPVTPADVRLVRVVLSIDSNPNEPPGPMELTTQVSIRNVKDNL